MSSHREAPESSKDPVADNTDVYAFVSPERPDRVVLISNYIPLQFPSSGPNFWRFDDNVMYEIMVDNTGDAVEDLTFHGAGGAVIDVEVFLRAGYGYEIGCEVVGRHGVARLTNQPLAAQSSAFRISGGRDRDFLVRFADAYRRELDEWIMGVERGSVDGPNAWDGYAAAAVTDACIASLAGGVPVQVELQARPALYTSE